MSTAVSARTQRAQHRAAQSASLLRRPPVRMQSAAGVNRKILSERFIDDHRFNNGTRANRHNALPK